MKANKILRDQIFEAIMIQIRDNKPPETKKTYDRLIGLGYSDFVTKQLIGQCIAVELFDAMKNKNPYNEQRYIKNLQQLPKQPFDVV